MKSSRIRLLAALAATGLVFVTAPAHASDAEPTPSVTAPIMKPDPSERIIPHPRPPRIPPCPRPAPPGWAMPLYCEIGPVLPDPKPPWDIIDPIIPDPHPGPGLPVEPINERI